MGDVFIIILQSSRRLGIYINNIRERRQTKILLCFIKHYSFYKASQ